jgi:hypothetical protein
MRSKAGAARPDYPRGAVAPLPWGALRAPSAACLAPLLRMVLPPPAPPQRPKERP